MAFHLLSMELWERAEHYRYYREMVKTRYTVTIQVDITNLLTRAREKELHFYPTFIYVLMRAVNEYKEFRMALDLQGRIGYWDVTHPSYTIFHEDDHTFSDVWSTYDPEFPVFYKQVTDDMNRYANVKGIKAKPDVPPNFCPISCVPWLSFAAYASDAYAESKMLYPLLVFGKYEEKAGRTLLPLSATVNHAVADGYHTCRLLNDVQRIADEALEWIK